MPPETAKRLVVAVDELSDQAFACRRALVLTSEPLIDVLAEWYAADNFGKSAYSRLVPLMA